LTFVGSYRRGLTPFGLAVSSAFVSPFTEGVPCLAWNGWPEVLAAFG